MADVKLDAVDLITLDQCDAARSVKFLNERIAAMQANIAMLQRELTRAQSGVRDVQVTVCAAHNVTVQPNQRITRVTRQDGDYLIVN